MVAVTVISTPGDEEHVAGNEPQPVRDPPAETWLLFAFPECQIPQAYLNMIRVSNRACILVHNSARKNRRSGGTMLGNPQGLRTGDVGLVQHSSSNCGRTSGDHHSNYRPNSSYQELKE